MPESCFPTKNFSASTSSSPTSATCSNTRDEVKAILLTHGHEDHIGAIPFIFPYLNVPIYGSSFTMALVKSKLEQHGMLQAKRLHTIKAKDVVEFGPFSVEFFHVTHSIVDAFALAIKTPAGMIIHTGDFKIDPTPDRRTGRSISTRCRLTAIRACWRCFPTARMPIMAATRSPNARVNDRFESIFRSSKGQIILSCFTSSIPRLQLVIDQAKQFDRVVTFLGRRMVSNTEVAEELGFLNIPQGHGDPLEGYSKKYPREKVVVVAGGCQGEPLSALSRIALDTHKEVKVEQGDTVILSARMIPGNEQSVSRMMDHFYRRKTELYYPDGAQPPVHVSGHASQEELTLVLSIVKPRFFIPIHGMYRQLHRHARLAEKSGAVREKVILAETGDIIRFNAERREHRRQGAGRPRAD